MVKSAPAEFVTSSFVHDGHRLVYDVYGSGPRVIVYLHGLLLDSDLNRGLASALAEAGNQVVLLDLLGHGRSDKPLHAAEYRIDSYAEQVIGLLDHLGVPSAVLGGMSLGANVSLFAASEYPDRVRSLVLEMPVLEWAVPSAAAVFVPLLLAAHYGRSVLTPVSSIIRRIPDSPFAPLNSLLHAAGLPPRVMSAVLHGVLVGPVAPTQDERAAIAAPTLILAHRSDLIHPFEDASHLAELMSTARLEGTRSIVELRLFPQRLTARIAEFIEQTWADAAPKIGAPRAAGSSRRRGG